MHLRLEQPIAAGADSVWQALGPRFAHISEWSTFVKSSRALDRSEVPPGFSVAPTAPVPGRETVTKARLIEILTAYSDENRTLTFDAAGLPRIITRARDVQSVHASGPDASTVVFEIDFDFAGPFSVFSPIVKRRMTKTFGDLLLDLKDHVESMDRPTQERPAP